MFSYFLVEFGKLVILSLLKVKITSPKSSYFYYILLAKTIKRTFYVKLNFL
jgi:hypothetical protein